MILSTSLYQFAHSDHHAIQSNLISKNRNDHQSPIMTTIKDNETQNGSFNIIVRMIAFGIQRTDDDEQQKLIDNDVSETNNKKFLLPSNKDSDRSENEQTEELQQNTRLLLLPLMIRMLFERMSERADAIEQLKDLQKSDEVRIKFFLIQYSTNLFS
jgi:hypothetical protein